MRCSGVVLAVCVCALGCGGRGGGKGPPKIGVGGTSGGGSGGSSAAGGAGGSGTGGYGAVDAGPPPSVEWVRRFGSTGLDQAIGVARNAGGDVYVVGSFEEAVDFGTGIKQSNGGGDSFVLALSAEGSTSWALAFGGTGYDGTDGVVVDSQGNLFVSGSISGPVDLGSGAMAFGGDNDVFIAKLAPDGTALWAKSYGATGFDVGCEPVVDALGNIIFGGSFEGTVDFGGGPRTAAGKSDAFVVKLTSDGNHVWDSTFGDAYDMQDFTRDLAVDENGDVYAVSIWVTSLDDIGFSVQRLNAATGSTVWNRPIAQDVGHCRAETVTVRSDAVLVGGYVPGSIPLGSATITSSDDDPVIVSFDPSDGAVQWFREWHGTGNDHVYGIATFGDEILFTGRIAEDLSLDGAEATQGCQDVYLARLSADGAPRGAATFGGSECGDIGRTVVPYADSRVLLVGMVAGTVTIFDEPTIGEVDDAFVALVSLP